MATRTPLQVIDADAHVIETERTWDYLEPAEQQFRPLLVASPQERVTETLQAHNLFELPQRRDMLVRKGEPPSACFGNDMGGS